MNQTLWTDLLDEESTRMAEVLAVALPTPLHTLGLEGVRAFAAPQPPPRLTPMARVLDHHTGETAVRIREYRPEEGSSLPAVLYLHGGGFTVGSLDGVDELCRRIAAQAGCAVFSVEYRLAPEHPYPAALDDARAAYAWLLDDALRLGVDPARIAVAGDSAGGSLAASLCLALREEGRPQPVMQLLAYPAVDDTFSRPSWSDFADAPLLGREDALWFRDQYLGTVGYPQDALASPMRATTLRGLAPAHIITAEVDPLRDDAEAYAARLAADGVSVTRKRYAGVFHGFFTEVEVYTKARAAVADACAQLRTAFAG